MTVQTAWASSDNPFDLLQQVSLSNYVRRFTRRKMRLYGCAVVRSVWDSLALAPDSRTAVEMAELISDGLYKPFTPYPIGMVMSSEGVWAAARRLVGPEIELDDLNWLLDRGSRGSQPLDHAICAHLLRDVVGDPWHPPHWRGTEIYWSDGTHQQGWWLTTQVRDLALAAYEDRPASGVLERDRFWVLADALEDAGLSAERLCVTCMGHGFVEAGPTGGPRCPECRNHLQNEWLPDSSAQPRMRCTSCKTVFVPPVCAQCRGARRMAHPLLAHLRSEGPHCRGYWALDVLLGRK